MKNLENLEKLVTGSDDRFMNEAEAEKNLFKPAKCLLKLPSC